MRILGCYMGFRRKYVIFPILLVLFLGGVLTALLPPAEDHGDVGILGIQRRASIRSSVLDHQAESSQKFTIIIQTYNRTDVLLKLLNHYQAVPNLHKIIIVWNNIGEQTPEKLWESFGPHPVQVVFKQQTRNLMRNRLQSFSEAETDALLMLDDDTLLSVPDISFAFSVWKQFPDQIVGFVPRKHVSTPSGVYGYGSFELQDPETAGGDRYSMVLIGAAFFHRRYLQHFQDQPQAVHILVDETQNCDDIAVNFAVALYLNRDSNTNTARKAQGMWHRPEHLLQRSYCLNKLVQIYGSMPLSYSNLMISQFGFPNYANHKGR